MLIVCCVNRGVYYSTSFIYLFFRLLFSGVLFLVLVVGCCAFATSLLTPSYGMYGQVLRLHDPGGHCARIQGGVPGVRECGGGSVGVPAEEDHGVSSQGKPGALVRGENETCRTHLLTSTIVAALTYR